MNGIARQVIAVKKIFPWHIQSQCGFTMASQIRESTIPDGGIARFALEPVKAGEIFHSSEVLPVKKFLQLCPEKKTIPADMVNMLKIDDASDLDRIFEHFGLDDGVRENSSSDDADSTSVAREAEIMQKMSWFVGSSQPSPTAGKNSNIFTLMSTHSIHINHSDEHANSVVCIYDDNRCIFSATKDIAAGDEYFLDYNKFSFPTDIKDWFASRNLEDVVTMMEQFDEVPQQV